MNIPFFSIILPTYNRAHFLPRAIESVLSQIFEDWELVIVDDGSTDNTKEVVASYTDQRIVYISQHNQERSAARNNGINHAKSEYICFLDSDDYYLPEKLSNFKNAIDSSTKEKQLIFYDGLIFELGNDRKEAPIQRKKSEETLHEFLLLNPLFSQQICAPKSVFLKQKFDPRLRIGEDVELWLRMVDYAQFEKVDSHETIIVEHEDRSVNLKKYDSANEQLKQLNLIFQRYDDQQISKKVRRQLVSNCYFNSAKHYMMTNQKMKAITFTLKSILKDFSNNQLKHRIYCLSNLILGSIPREYKH